MSRYFVHLPPSGCPAFFWRRLSRFAGELIQINLNLLAYVLGDDPQLLVPTDGNLIFADNYRFGTGTFQNVDLRPFAYTFKRDSPARPRPLSIGPKLQRFLDDPLSGESMGLSFPFRDKNIKLGRNGGGWFRDNDDDSAFHGGTDFVTSPQAVFNVCAAADGRVLAKPNSNSSDGSGAAIVLSHFTASGKEFRTIYQHLDMTSSPTAITVNANVSRGQLLGSTIDKTTADPDHIIHLHFGVAVLGPAKQVNGVNVPQLWYFIDPWGVYDFRRNNYLSPTGGIFESPILGAKHTIQWRARPPLRQMVPASDGVIAAFELGTIYFSPDGQNLGGGGNTTAVYDGSQKVCAITSYQNAVLTAFSGGGIYLSPDGQNLGGGGNTIRVYSGRQQVVAMIPYQNAVLTAFSGGGIYLSPDGQNLGRGVNSVTVF
jgi:Peptidase family M23